MPLSFSLKGVWTLKPILISKTLAFRVMEDLEVWDFGLKGIFRDLWGVVVLT